MEELARPDGEKAVLSEPLRHRLPFVSNPFLPKVVQKVPRLGGIGPSPGPAMDGQHTDNTKPTVVSARSSRRWLCSDGCCCCAAAAAAAAPPLLDLITRNAHERVARGCAERVLYVGPGVDGAFARKFVEVRGLHVVMPVSTNLRP